MTVFRIIAASMVLITTAFADLRDGLISYWPFETVTTEVTPDVISGNDLFLYKMSRTNLVSGRFGNALSFNGKTEFLALNYPQSPKLPIHAEKAYSVSMWIKGKPGQANRIVFAEGLTTDRKPLFLLGTQLEGKSSGINVLIRNTSDPLVDNVFGESVVFDDTWHNVTWVDEQGTVRMYVDGVLDAVNFNYARTRVALNNLSVGALLRSPPMYHFAGCIDEVAIWKRALSQREIRDLIGGALHTAVDTNTQ